MSYSTSMVSQHCTRHLGEGHAHIVKVLIQNGADVNLISKASIIAIAKFIFEILTRI